jgi:hypothetical protein
MSATPHIRALAAAHRPATAATTIQAGQPAGAGQGQSPRPTGPAPSDAPRTGSPPQTQSPRGPMPSTPVKWEGSAWSLGFETHPESALRELEQISANRGLDLIVAHTIFLFLLCEVCTQGRMATHSISTETSFGRRATSTVARAGLLSPNTWR